MNKEKEWQGALPVFERPPPNSQNDEPIIINESGSKIWKNKKGERHRLDGPAFEGFDGDKSWWVNGKLHREDGPAIEYACGNKQWWVNGKLHREDGPAIEYASGVKYFYLNDRKVEEKDLPINQWPKCKIDEIGNKFWKNKDDHLHREDGPAMEWNNGDKSWWINGSLHREDGPAIEKNNGDKIWCKNGKEHREGGPAVENANGDKAWYINGKRHREEGAAVEYVNGGKEYWLNDKRVEEKDLPMNKEKELLTQQKWPKCTIDKNGNKEWRNEQGQLHKEDGPAFEYSNGDKWWYINDQLHRENGPAIERANGDKSWCKKGDLHRDDGPAYEGINGDKHWYKNGKKHREDGPAVEFANGDKEYWLNHKRVEEKDLSMNKKEEWPQCTTNENGDKKWRNEKGQLHRLDGPAVEYKNGTKEWFINGALHRDDGPAVEWFDGSKWWYKNGSRHRDIKDGPAMEYVGAEFNNKYYLNGIEVPNELSNKKESIYETSDVEKLKYLAHLIDIGAISKKSLGIDFGEADFVEKYLPMNKKEEWPKCTIDECGDKYWKNKKGEYHREDGPAIEWATGSKSWYVNGKIHRENGPAVESVNGDKSWCKNGQTHREDGPAVEFIDGTKFWYKNGLLHREDGPAREWKDGNKAWYTNGQLHRKDGPAIEWINGDKVYYLNGKKVEEKDLSMNKKEEWPKCTIDKHGNKHWKNEKGEYHRENGPAYEEINGNKEYWLNGSLIKEKDLPINQWPKCSVDESGNKVWKNEKGQYHRENGPAVESSNGNKSWLINGKYHREDGPAYEDINGNKEWFINGSRHRYDGPAMENPDGYKAWFKNGQHHREDGPAIEFSDGNKQYWLNDKQVEERDLPMNKEEEWPKCEIKDGTKYWKNEAGDYHREDGPAIEYYYGTNEWYKNGKIHREDGPAVEWKNGSKAWWINGLLHKEDGPAIEWANGTKEYWLDGKKVEEKDLPMNKKEKTEIKDDSSKIIWKNEKGEYHREGGPSVEWTNGTEYWYIDEDGTKIWENESGQTHRKDGPAVELSDGIKYWYKNGKLHREDGPAVENPNGNKQWIINGKFHREDGPSYEKSNGDKYWHINGNLHRENGPAKEFANGDKEYYLNGVKVEEKDLPINKKENKVFTMIKQDGTKASYRIASKQMTKIVKNSILQIIKNTNPAKSQISSVSKFLDTDVGKSFISFILGLGLGNTPKIKDNKHMIKICKELRVEGISTAGNFFVNEVLKNVIPLISNKEKLRIDEPTEEQIASNELITDEQENKKSELI